MHTRPSCILYSAYLNPVPSKQFTHPSFTLQSVYIWIVLASPCTVVRVQSYHPTVWIHSSCSPGTVNSSCSTDTVNSSCSPDTVNSSCSPDTVNSSCSTDTVNLSCSPDTVHSSCSPDTVNASCSPDTVNSSCSPDTVNLSCSPDTVNSSCRPDTVYLSCSPYKFYPSKLMWSVVKTNKIAKKMILENYYFKICFLLVFTFHKCVRSSPINVTFDFIKKWTNMFYNLLLCLHCTITMYCLHITNYMHSSPFYSRVCHTFLVFPQRKVSYIILCKQTVPTEGGGYFTYMGD